MRYAPTDKNSQAGFVRESRLLPNRKKKPLNPNNNLPNKIGSKGSKIGLSSQSAHPFSRSVTFNADNKLQNIVLDKFWEMYFSYYNSTRMILSFCQKKQSGYQCPPPLTTHRPPFTIDHVARTNSHLFDCPAVLRRGGLFLLATGEGGLQHRSGKNRPGKGRRPARTRFPAPPH